MSENSSDSDSSCGWTVINHEGSDVEMVNSVTASDSCELSPACSSLEELPVLQLEQKESSQNSTLLVGGAACPTLEESKSTIEAEVAVPEDNVYFGTASDDSDIVTLEPPRLEEIGSQELVTVKDVHGSEDFNMGSSSSSQYAFCQPEAVFSSPPSEDESSSDETSNQPSLAVRRRRGRKKTMSTSEPEQQLLEQENEPSKEPSTRQFGSGLNKCVILALVIAVSMGFGHFYGTIQIQKRQQLVRKTHEDEVSDIKDYHQRRQELQSLVDSETLRENLMRCWSFSEAETIFLETQKNNLAAENQHLKLSLAKEEKATAFLQEELRKLREQVRALEDKGTSAEVIRENHSLKQHLEEEKQKIHSFLGQREALLAEMRMLTRELERERLITTSLRSQLQHSFPSQLQDHSDSSKVLTEKQEVVMLREKLTKLEQKLNFEQQRSDLWERLYVEAKDENGKQETEGKKRGARGQYRAKRKPKETFLGTVKETFDAMKNSTKEFVRHHKEKIKQAKEAVKENLKKFSDSVKSTFRHFKDTTKNIFDEKGNKRFGDMKEEAAEKPRTVFGEFWHPQHKASPQNQGGRGPSPLRDGGRTKASHFEEFRKSADSQKGSAGGDGSQNCPTFRKVCSGAVGCAPQEPANPFHLVSHVRIDEFKQLIQRYLLQELGAFHHWEELDQFISKFFLNGVFKHDQKLFTEFVNDVKDYLKDLKEYDIDNGGVFEKLDGYLYRHFGHTFPLPYGPSRPDKKQRMVNIENSRHRKQEPKRLQPQPYKREGKWHKHGRANGRHMARLEIELGQLPFDPKY
uniref:cell cycle progression protein 1 n=1 Tax=Jaculus jaculus TaxID=51337 RepID=UPI000332FAB0|nr:cell cycle progression protein 1 [Jaculus jaculus]XP_045015864.1 cell cycle progression protein 1 [Jaculus jaculus]